jgi:DNA polymerase-3 subunit epsilon
MSGSCLSSLTTFGTTSITCCCEWRIYALLRDRYRRRDGLERLVEYRRRYVETLLQDGEEEAEHVAGAHEEAQVELETDYESLDRNADRRTEPTAEQEQEIKALWRKLVKIYHPDRNSGEPEKQERYNLLMQAINQARDGGDIDVLRDITDDPEGYIGRQGWGRLDIDNGDNPDHLTRLYEGLRTRIFTVLDSLNALHERPAFDLHRRIEAAPEVLGEIVEEQGAILDEEFDALLAEAQQLGREIEELTGESCRVIL